MLNDRLAELISRKLSGEASAAESEELQQYLQSHPEEQYFLELLNNYWNAPKEIKDTEDLHPDIHFEHILQSAQDDKSEVDIKPQNAEKHSISWIKRVSIAAIIVSLMFGTYWFLTSKTPTNNNTVIKNEKSIVLAKTGARSKLLLPDGTAVWLNSESKLVYNSNFNDTIREVELEGEAFFEVTKNLKRPFIVHTSGIDIRVLGTEFNVKSYPAEKTIEATLIRGSIEVVKKDEPKAPKVILRAHEKLVFNKESNVLQKTTNDNLKSALSNQPASGISITALPKNLPDTSIAETSWIYNKLIFDGDTFRELAQKMERWFNVKIFFKNEEVANYRFHGGFENENIEQALNALKLTASFNYKINDNEVDIYK